MDDQKKKMWLFGLLGAFVGLFVVGTFFPRWFWGANAFAFLPLGTSLLVTGGVVAVVAWAWKGHVQLGLKVPGGKGFELGLSAFLALGTALLVHFLPMVDDQYGDFFFIRQSIDLTIQVWDPRLLEELVSFDLVDGKIGTRSFYAIVNMASYLTGWNGKDVFLFLLAVGGGLFAWIWSRWVFRRVPDWGIRISLLGIGLLSPVILNFAGHFETYGFILVGMLAFVSQLDAFFQRPGRWRFVGVVALWLLTWKFHISGSIFFPAVLLAGLHWWSQKKPGLAKLFSWKNALLWLALPGVLLTVVVYVFVTDSWNGGRTFTNDTLDEVLFLPVRTLESAPLDRYNLFSFSHLLDFFNAVWMTSAAGIFALLAGLVVFRDRFSWGKPLVIVAAISLLAFWGAFFLMNPLLGMPHDWDLFCIPFPLVLLVLVQFAGQSSGKSGLRRIWLGALAVSVLGSSMLFLHWDREALSGRYESISVRSFETAWIGSSVRILSGIELSSDSLSHPDRLAGVVEELAPLAVPGNDLEYANLHHELGKWHFAKGDYPASEVHFKQAYLYLKNLTQNPFYLVSALFMQEKYKEASEYSEILAGLAYPSREKALRMVIHVNLEADNAIEARKASEVFVEEFPQDLFIVDLLQALRNGVPASDLKARFRSR